MFLHQSRKSYAVLFSLRIREVKMKCLMCKIESFSNPVCAECAEWYEARPIMDQIDEIDLTYGGLVYLTDMVIEDAMRSL